MAETLTDIIKLRKRERGDTDWHSSMNSNVDDLDQYIGLSGADPNITSVEVKFIGQKFYQVNANAWWTGSTVGVPPFGVWMRDIPRGLVSAFSGSVAPAGWHLADGSIVVIDTVSLTMPDLRGRFIVGYTNEDVDYDTIGKVGGETKHFVAEENIASFDIGPPDVQTGTGSGHAFGIGEGVTFDNPSTPVQLSVGTAVPIALENRPPYYTEAWIVKL